MKSIFSLFYFLIPLIFIFPLPVFGQIDINEMAWMGTLADWRDEWIELHNSGNENIDLSGWTLVIQGKKEIILEGNIGAAGYFVIRRPDESNPSDVPTDLFASFGQGLSNSGEILILKNSSGAETDRVDGSDNWKIGAASETTGNNITKETAQKSFNNWITGQPTPKTQNYQSPSGQTNVPQQQSILSNPTPAASTSDEIKIKAIPPLEKIGLVGQKIIFEGKALGAENLPLENAQFHWNFGDGLTASGNPVFHIYRYPGNYTVLLNVSSGVYASSGNLMVKINSPSLEISELKPGKGGYIEIRNSSGETLNISGISLNEANQVFHFPEETYIGQKAYLAISDDISKIILPAESELNLLLANNSLIQKLAYRGNLKQNESFHNINGETKIGIQSPGNGEFIQNSITASNPTPPLLPTPKPLKLNTSSPFANQSPTTTIQAVGRQLTAGPADILYREQISPLTSSLYFWLGLVSVLGLLSAFAVFFFLKTKK